MMACGGTLIAGNVYAGGNTGTAGGCARAGQGTDGKSLN